MYAYYACSKDVESNSTFYGLQAPPLISYYPREFLPETEWKLGVLWTLLEAHMNAFCLLSLFWVVFNFSASMFHMCPG